MDVAQQVTQDEINAEVLDRIDVLEDRVAMLAKVVDTLSDAILKMLGGEPND